MVAGVAVRDRERVESVVHYHHVFSMLIELLCLRWGNFRVMVAGRGFW